MTYDQLVLLHLSDLHFKAGTAGQPYDPDFPVRAALIEDVRRMLPRTGPVNAILVSGDISYQGIEEEFNFAVKWLAEVAAAAGCKPENTFVVPGNHDVNRAMWKQNPMIGDMQRAIRDAPPARRMDVLQARLSNAASCEAMLAPLAAYNEFAAKFDCAITSLDRLFWESKMPLTGGPTIIVRGLNSVLLSGPNDAVGQLYLSPLQTNHSPPRGCLYVTMCHHPSDWFCDAEEADDAITHRSALHLLGHKHRQRLRRDGWHCRVAAAATLPPRDETSWEPGYNLIRLVPPNAGGNLLTCEFYQRRWQSAPERFVAVRNVDDTDAFFQSIPFVLDDAVVAAKPAQSECSTSVVEPIPREVEAAMSDTSDRSVIFRFWGLSGAQRRAILDELGVTDPADKDLAEPERVRRSLERVRARDLTEALAERVTKQGRAIG